MDAGLSSVSVGIQSGGGMPGWCGCSVATHALRVLTLRVSIYLLLAVLLTCFIADSQGLHWSESRRWFRKPS